MDYKILYAILMEKLELEVTEHLEKGYLPVGGLVIDGDYYKQAMYKPIPEGHGFIRANEK